MYGGDVLGIIIALGQMISLTDMATPTNAYKLQTKIHVIKTIAYKQMNR